tara:strand:+ start:5270 stop:6436 length:1167 start_codon:yes stop_codon:yes gene_type:complete
MRITIVGLGYVGFSLSLLLAQKHSVIGLDTDEIKINKLNKKKSLIEDRDIKKFIKNTKLNLEATINSNYAYKHSDYIIIAVPTNYNYETGNFNTEIVEKVIVDILKINKTASIVIKSTVPIGFTDKVRKTNKNKNIFFSPEFLREGKSLHDNLYPSRIIVGEKNKKAIKFGSILKELSLDIHTPLVFISSREAESIKLFSNTFLAMRVSFFNELDTFCEINKLNSKDIIEGVCLDKRIGNYYNNPSFGYGGYCLPKDTKQLLSSYENIPNNIIKSVINANDTRKDYICSSILKKKPKVVGVYRLVMKSESDNFKESAVLDIAEKLKTSGVKIIIFEPFLTKEYFKEFKCYSTLSTFAKKSDLIIANRVTDDLLKFKHKVYTRDIFKEN